jgi:hypothetical protein
MATKKPQQKSVLSQLQSVGEGAIEKITQNPATRQAIQGAMNLRDRGEQLVTGLVAIEKRLLAVEKRLAALEGEGKRVTTTARTAATKARSTTTAKARTTATKARTTATKARSAASKPKPDA